MKSRTEDKLRDLNGMQHQAAELLDQAWERGRKYGMAEAIENKLPAIIDGLEKAEEETTEAEETTELEIYQLISAGVLLRRQEMIIEYQCKACGCFSIILQGQEQSHYCPICGRKARGGTA